MGMFSKKEKSLIHSLLTVYNEFAGLDYMKQLNYMLWQRVDNDEMRADDVKRLHAYVENISALTVSAVVEDTENKESMLLNQQLLSILLKLDDAMQ